MKAILVFCILLTAACAALSPSGRADPMSPPSQAPSTPADTIAPDFVLMADKTHNKLSRTIPPVITVHSGAIVEAYTQEATGGQLKLGDGALELDTVDWDRVHTLTGPVYVEGAEPGDTLAVTLLELEPGDWGWTGVWPDFGFLVEEEKTLDLKTYVLDKTSNTIEFMDGVTVPLNPFPGVMGVAPDTDQMLSTNPSRANGGNMDDPHIVAGTTVYFPIFVKGALFSIGDTHAAQGMGEVGGSAVEAPMRIVYQIRVIKGGRKISEPQYETDVYYATTGFAPTLNKAAKKATRYMIDHLVHTRGMSRSDAYMLCSIACDLKIAEVVDVPNMLVAMHLRKDIFND